MATLVRTSDRPAADQADFWRHTISSAFGPFHLRPSGRGAFPARLLGRTYGEVEAGDVRAPAHEVRRVDRQIARDTRECYKIGLVLRGCCVLRQNGRRVAVAAGDAVFYDLTRPVEITFGAHHIFTVVIPHHALPLPHDRVAGLGGTLLSARARTGRLVTSLLTALAEEAGEHAGGGDRGDGEHRTAPDAAPGTTAPDEPYAHHLGSAIVELVAGAAGEWLGVRDEDARRAPGRAAMLRAVQEWIEARLHEPDLSPVRIAAAHHISVRQLYRLFQPTGTTVARYVRDRRLEQCRRELADPFLGTQRIGAIAARWGVPDAAAFSRAFRAAYGVTPSAYRAAATGFRRPGEPPA